MSLRPPEDDTSVSESAVDRVEEPGSMRLRDPGRTTSPARRRPAAATVTVKVTVPVRWVRATGRGLREGTDPEHPGTGMMKGNGPAEGRVAASRMTRMRRADHSVQCWVLPYYPSRHLFASRTIVNDGDEVNKCCFASWIG